MGKPYPVRRAFILAFDQFRIAAARRVAALGRAGGIQPAVSRRPRVSAATQVKQQLEICIERT